jgi:hypothetical protein
MGIERLECEKTTTMNTDINQSFLEAQQQMMELDESRDFLSEILKKKEHQQKIIENEIKKLEEKKNNLNREAKRIVVWEDVLITPLSFTLLFQGCMQYDGVSDNRYHINGSRYKKDAKGITVNFATLFFQERTPKDRWQNKEFYERGVFLLELRKTDEPGFVLMDDQLRILLVKPQLCEHGHTITAEDIVKIKHNAQLKKCFDFVRQKTSKQLV